MSEFVEQANFDELILNSSSVLDVRSEGEFMAGALPGAVNIPILNNSERAEVGTIYKLQGQEVAIQKGHALVSRDTKQERISKWISILSCNSNPVLYCARGGLRSKIAQSWIRENGIPVGRVRGGYKKLRNYLININQALPNTFNFILIAGKTGSRKTRFLNSIKVNKAAIDLEELAHHRGSAFGDVYGDQPSQANFENNLARDLLTLSAVRKNSAELFIEAESRRIGKCYIPEIVWQKMSEAKILILEVPLEERVENIFEDYILFLLDKYRSENVNSPPKRLSQYLQNSLARIASHLGNERTSKVFGLIQDAIEDQVKTGRLDLHKDWIRTLLVSYYDPHYERNVASYESRILGTGHPIKLLTSLG